MCSSDLMMGVETSQGDMWAHVRLVMGDWDVLNHLNKLGFENKVVECNLVALGIISLVNVAIVGLGMVGALLG